MAIRLKWPSGVTVHLFVVYAPTRKTNQTPRVFDERLGDCYEELTAASATAT